MQQPEEPILRELFQQQKKNDERRAPSFAATWSAAQARLEPSARAVPVQWARRSRWAWVAAVLLIAGGLIVYRTMQKEKSQGRGERTVQAPSSPPFVDREARISVARPPRRDWRAPRPRHGNPPRRAPSIPPETVIAEEPDREGATEFFPLRFGTDHPPMESGEVIRVQVSRAALIALGLPVTVERADEAVKADLLIGEDGQARAIRFVR